MRFPRLLLMALLASGVVFGYGSALGWIDGGSHHCPHSHEPRGSTTAP